MTRTVLVVDDDPMIREVAALALARVGGWTVLQAADGAAAVRTARDARPDAVLLDVTLPVLDGPAVLQQLRADERTRDLPVVFLTAKAPAERRRLEQLGATGVIGKPFDALELVDKLRAILSW